LCAVEGINGIDQFLPVGSNLVVVLSDLLVKLPDTLIIFTDRGFPLVLNLIKLAFELRYIEFSCHHSPL